MHLQPGRAALWGFICLQVLSGCCGATPQETVDYIAANLQVRYKVDDNFQLDEPPSDYSPNTLVLTNAGDTDISGDPWGIYLCHIRLIYDTFDNFPNGVALGDSGLLAYHINGCHHKIGPDPNAEFEIPAGQSVEVTFYSNWWQVSRTDIMPNWYVTMDGATPKTITSTAGESLDFVEDFTEAHQYKRIRDDQYEPYSPEYRYDLNKDIGDLGSAQHLVIPTPVEENLDGDDFTVDDSWVVYTNDTELADEAIFLKDALNLEVSDTAPPSNFIELILDDVTDGSGAAIDNQESYKLTTSGDKISITGPTPAAVFFGIQSLLSLCESTPCTMPAGEMIDYPRFPHRGMFLDVGRNFHSVEDVKRLLEVMSRYKLNKFHFHLSDDEGWRVEIDGLEELSQVGANRCHDNQDACIMPQLGSGPEATLPGSGFYNAEEYRDILTYAAQRHIEVIPEIDIPGHAHAAINAMESRYRKFMEEGKEDESLEYLLRDPNDTARYISVQYFTDNAINPCMDSTYSFVEKVVQELKKLHQPIQPLKIFHFGGDEVPAGAWDSSPICDEFQSKNGDIDLMKYLVTRVAAIVASEGLDMAGWEDGLLDSEHEPYNITELPEGTTYYANAWSNIWEWGGGHQAYMLANGGYKSIISHATHFYFDHPYEPDPEERGFYWATRYTDTRKTFGYNMGDVYQNIEYDRMGNELDRDEVCNRDTIRCDELVKEDNLIGVQGQLWSETVRTSSQLDNMIFPRLLALAERAWHRPAWEDEGDDGEREEETRADWERFANTLGHRELGRLDAQGVKYAVPPPGATISSNDRQILSANTAYPGLPIKFSEDEGETWQDYSGPQEVSHDISVKTMSHDGTRESMVVHVFQTPPEPDTVPGLAWSYYSTILPLLLALLHMHVLIP